MIKAVFAFRPKSMIALLLGVVLSIFWESYWPELKAMADHWQQLLGSLIGAATPISLFLLSEIYQSNKKRNEFFLTLEKSIITAINNLSDIDLMLHRFVDVTLKVMESRINEDTKSNRHSVCQAFVPLSYTFTFDKGILKETTGSSYLENLVMQGS